MKKELQNSAGFLTTNLISKKPLISRVSNFDFSSGEVIAFSDTSLNIPERLMLGKRAERYFSEWIKQSQKYDLVAENIQVIEEKQTLGEFDFIVRRKSDQQLIHVELVYKLYLFDPNVNGTEFQHWIGPNKKDRLDYKLDKLSNHQFPLLFHDAAIAKLSDLNVDTDGIEQQVLFLANLFVPLGNEVQFNEVNEDAIEGKWMNLHQWEQTFDSQTLFAIPPKTDWFSKKLEAIEWLSKERAREMILSHHEQQRSPLVYSKDENGAQRRDFVVFW
jgi:hypothetical protein